MNRICKTRFAALRALLPGTRLCAALGLAAALNVVSCARSGPGGGFVHEPDADPVIKTLSEAPLARPAAGVDLRFG